MPPRKPEQFFSKRHTPAKVARWLKAIEVWVQGGTRKQQARAAGISLWTYQRVWLGEPDFQKLKEAVWQERLGLMVKKTAKSSVDNPMDADKTEDLSPGAKIA